MKGTLIFLTILFSLNFVFPQDTVRIMQYNLLYYGVNTGFCNDTNNNLENKNEALCKIIDYVEPDIFSVNEISTNVVYHNILLDSVLNISNNGYFQRASLTNFAGSGIGNQLYYDSRKFTLYNEYALINDLRDINFYTLYYNSPDLSWSEDTAFFTCIVVHLKAGSSQPDIDKRNEQVLQIINHLESINKKGNIFFIGDLNVYNSNEPAFQQLINAVNPDIRFYDPIHKIGNWNMNEIYAAYHTQSTHTITDCAVGGGLDDRFDFILTTLPVLLGTELMKYITGSYTTVGQDGQHFIMALTDEPPNTSAPWDVIQALYDASDHLPVYLDLKINQTPANIEAFLPLRHNINFKNPVTDNLELFFQSKNTTGLEIRIFDITGREVMNKSIFVNSGDNEIVLNVTHLKSGIYILSAVTNCGYRQTFKLIKM